MPTLVAIAGLPGSGKSYYIDSLSVPGHVAHDFMAGASGARLADSRHLVPLTRALNAGLDSLACDINFCLAPRRAELQAVIRELAPGARVEWRYFENAPDLCLANVRRRVRIRVSREEELIRKLSAQYAVPDGAATLPVWRPT
jgi:hypothetical protein